jgi:hypothetical protein
MANFYCYFAGLARLILKTVELLLGGRIFEPVVLFIRDEMLFQT